MAKRKGKRFGGIRRRAAGFHRKHPSLASKATSIVALLIGASPAISVGKDMITGGKSLDQATRDFKFLYTGFGDDNKFNIEGPLRGYVPILAGIGFKKGMSILLKHAKM